MRAAWAIARADIARRWKALMALALLTGLAGAVVLACAAGARRTDTVYERLLTASRSYDAEVSIVGELTSGLSEEQFREKVRALPMVEEAGSVAILPADEVGSTEPFEWKRNVGAVIDPSVGRTFEKARLVAGRHPRLDDPTEAAVSEALLENAGLSVGDTISFQPLTFDELYALFSGRPIVDPKPEPVEVEIVGVWRLPHDVAFSGESAGLTYLTPAFARGPGRGLASLAVTYVRLTGGRSSYSDFAEQVRALAGDPDAVDIGTQAELVGAVERAVDVQALALLAYAVLSGLTGVLLIGQAISRHVRHARDSDETLLAVGATRSTLTGAKVLSVMPVAVGAILIAVFAAIAVSPLFPIGFSRPLEPAPGTSFDPVLLACGGVGLSLLVIAAAGLTGRFRARSVSVGLGTRPAMLPELASRAGSSVSMISGLRFATMRGRGRSSVPLLSGLSGTMLGVAALVAAVTFAGSFETLLRSPAEYGWTWDLVVDGGDGREIAEQRGRALVESPHAEQVARIHTVAVRFKGATVSLLGFEPMKGDLRFRLIEGRMPSGPGEIALAEQTLRSAKAMVGDLVQMPGAQETCPAKTECSVPMRVVGTFVMPALEDAPTDEGGIVDIDALGSLASTDGFTNFLVTFTPGSSADSLAATLGGANHERAGRPSVEIQNLERVRSMPFFLAALLAALALATLAHLLITSVRRRRSDLAILKTLGFVKGQVRAAVGWLATTIVAVAVIVGTPLGVVLGRWAWAVLNTMLGTDAPVSFPAMAVALGAVAALVLANLIAALPGRAAARTQPALVLRTE